MKQIIIDAVTKSLSDITAQNGLSVDLAKISSSVERTRLVAHGDFASNIAMALARDLKMAPKAIAEKIITHLPDTPLIEKVEIAGAGFINFTLSKTAYFLELQRIQEHGALYGHNNSGQGEKVQVEFVSANPTGPLHVGHGRGAAIGDSLARILSANGYQVTREFYYNDAGAQINNLMLSTKARLHGLTPEDSSWPQDGYRGEYIQDIAKDFLAKETVTADDREIIASGDHNDDEGIRQFAVAYLRREQDLDLKAFGVHFDCYFLESSLYDDQSVNNVVNRLINNGVTYEQEGALWLKTTEFGDDKDRVMRKSDGSYTYFVPDVAYHKNKWARGFVRVINEQGADHHGTVARVRAGLQALDIGIPSGWPAYVLHQMVMVMRNGEEVKISKRAGSYLTLRDLIDEVGKDATRYFLVARKPDSQLQFDIDLARAQNTDNPVFYIQYAHARIASIFEERKHKSPFIPSKAAQHLQYLTLDHEYTLMRELAHFPEIIISANLHNAPHLIATYLQELAAAVHSYYNAKDEEGKAVRILVEDHKLQEARLYLLSCTKQVLINGLNLLGLSAPEKM